MSPDAKRDVSAGLPLDGVNLPLLGSRTSPEAMFQYLFQGVEANTVAFTCPAWLARREHFAVGDRVDLHLPIRTADGWHRQQAEIVAVTLETDTGGQACRAEYRDRQPLHHPVYASVDTGEIEFRSPEGELLDPDGLLEHVLRDCMLQKRGIAVYFKHLVPLFSRITLFPEADYGTVRSMLLEDIRRRIEANIATFEGWHEQALRGDLKASQLSRDLDLEKLRAAIEPEIEADLFTATFATTTIRPYLAAIRLLDHKLAMNHNTLVLLYARAL